MTMSINSATNSIVLKVKADKTDSRKKSHYLKEKLKHILTAENKVIEYEELRAEVAILDEKMSSLEEENREALITLG